MGLISAFSKWLLNRSDRAAKVGQLGDRVQRLTENGCLAGDVLNADETGVLDVGDDQTPALLTGNVTGDLTGDSAGEHTGDVLNADATAVLDVGDDQTPAVLTGNVTGNLSGDSAGEHTGDVLNADATAVLDVGDDQTPAVLTGNVTGALTGDSGGVHTGEVIQPSATVAADGDSQATAAAVAAGFTLVTSADDAKGVRLPAAAAGKVCTIRNLAADKDLLVYPATDDKINGGAANAAITMADGTSASFYAFDGTDWYTVPTLPS